LARRTSLFVYGTLQRSQQMDAVLRGASNWRYAGTATVAGELYDAGDYPVLVLNRRSRSKVRGRIVEIDDSMAALALLDDYEGVREGLYVRRRRRVDVADGSRRIAWVYEYARPVDGMRRIAAWPTVRRAAHAAR
jgi:gamma-glutamylcyclotransferase (GGCT)/AIG2-like uncharacterized protein YtfP